MGNYERGMACEWMGEKVPDMSRERLIEFIGQLDLVYEMAVRGELPVQAEAA